MREERAPSEYSFGVVDLMAGVAVFAIVLTPVVSALKSSGPETLILTVLLDLILFPGILTVWIRFRVKNLSLRKELTRGLWLMVGFVIAAPFVTIALVWLCLGSFRAIHQWIQVF
jgi:hypothetical protein